VQRGPLPHWLEPQLATIARTPPAGDEWVHEIKLDGYRLVARITAAGAAELRTRCGGDWTSSFLAVAAALRQRSLKSLTRSDSARRPVQ
jgi:bifunctional non-homologous end joining protein LigD